MEINFAVFLNYPNGAMCPRVKRFLLIKNQPKVNQNHLFQQRIFCHVADSNVIY